MKVGRRTVEIGNPDKLLFPAAGVTKLELAEYYRDVSGVLLPHVRDRFVSMHRFPDGIEAEGFYQKNVPDYFPDWIRTEDVRKEDGTLRQLVIEDAATLVFLADQACITPHVWLSRTDRPRHPDRLVFDLDPPGTDSAAEFKQVCWAARRIREVLRQLKLPGYVQTSGSRGLHIHVPLDRGAGFDTVRAFARDMADLLARRHPARLTTEQRKKKRGDRIFLDVQRNAYGQTVVAPYAVPARPSPPPSTGTSCTAPI
jgi:bifunctional non-homologous end joining protein LigD